MIDNRWHAWLAYAGTLPFIGCAVAPLIGLGSLSGIAASYGLAIVSFMAGVHWGTSLYHSPPVRLLLTSNVITLAAWFAFLLAPITIMLGILTAAFIALLLIDIRLTGAGLLSEAYLTTRRNVTAIVVFMLLVTMAGA